MGTLLTSRYPGSWRHLNWRTIHGCGPAPESHRLPLSGSTTTANSYPRTVSRQVHPRAPVGRGTPWLDLTATRLGRVIAGPCASFTSSEGRRTGEVLGLPELDERLQPRTGETVTTRVVAIRRGNWRRQPRRSCAREPTTSGASSPTATLLRPAGSLVVYGLEIPTTGARTPLSPLTAPRWCPHGRAQPDPRRQLGIEEARAAAASAFLDGARAR
jgi:hypothetical protein